jgi:hypothetical protein
LITIYQLSCFAFIPLEGSSISFSPGCPKERTAAVLDKNFQDKKNTHQQQHTYQYFYQRIWKFPWSEPLFYCMRMPRIVYIASRKPKLADSRSLVNSCRIIPTLSAKKIIRGRIFGASNRFMIRTFLNPTRSCAGHIDDTDIVLT